MASSTVGNVDITSSPIVLITVPLNWCCGIFHDVETGTGDRLAGLGIAEFVVQLGAANHVREDDRYFEIPSHKQMLT